MSGRVDRGVIRRFYDDQTSATKLPLKMELGGFTACTTPTGLGDTLMLSVLPRASAQVGKTSSIYALSSCFETLCSFNPFYRSQLEPFFAFSDKLIYGYNLGGGHFTQRLERAWDLPVDLVPRPCLVVAGARVHRNSVVLHLGPGREKNLKRQRQSVHPRAREVYPETRDVLQRFIKAHSEMSFCEVGDVSSGLENVSDWTGLPLQETIVRMATCEYFIGINSGPMHIAAALDLRIIGIINFPAPERLVLPVMKDVGLFDAEWLYPQSVLLHQDAEGPLVPRLTYASLERAMAGDVYPYWSTDYLDLIEENREWNARSVHIGWEEARGTQ